MPTLFSSQSERIRTEVEDLVTGMSKGSLKDKETERLKKDFCSWAGCVHYAAETMPRKLQCFQGGRSLLCLALNVK